MHTSRLAKDKIELLNLKLVWQFSICWLDKGLKLEKIKHQGKFAKIYAMKGSLLFDTARGRKTQWSESLHAEKQHHYFCVDWWAEIGSHCATTPYLGLSDLEYYNLHIFQKTYCYWRFGNKSCCCRRKGALNKELIYTFPFLWLFSSWNSRTLHAKELSTQNAPKHRRQWKTLDCSNNLRWSEFWQICTSLLGFRDDEYQVKKYILENKYA